MTLHASRASQCCYFQSASPIARCAAGSSNSTVLGRTHFPPHTMSLLGLLDNPFQYPPPPSLRDASMAPASAEDDVSFLVLQSENQARSFEAVIDTLSTSLRFLDLLGDPTAFQDHESLGLLISCFVEYAAFDPYARLLVSREPEDQWTVFDATLLLFTSSLDEDTNMEQDQNPPPPSGPSGSGGTSGMPKGKGPAIPKYASRTLALPVPNMATKPHHLYATAIGPKLLPVAPPASASALALQLAALTPGINSTTLFALVAKAQRPRPPLPWPTDAGGPHPSTKHLKTTTHGPSCKQMLVVVDSPNVCLPTDHATDVANTYLAREKWSCCVLSAQAAYGGWFLSTTDMPNNVDIAAVHKGLQVEIFPQVQNLEIYLPQSKSYLKVLDIPVFKLDGKKTNNEDIATVICSHFVLVGKICVVCNSKSSNHATVYFVVWDSQCRL